MTLKQIKKEAGEEFDSTYKIVCSAHERTSSCKCICDELTDLNEEYQNIKKFWVKKMDTLASEMEKSIRLEEKVEKRVCRDALFADRDFNRAIKEQDQKLKEFKQ